MKNVCIIIFRLQISPSWRNLELANDAAADHLLESLFLDLRLGGCNDLGGIRIIESDIC